MTTPERWLFLSPHYDDAVYSCGGTIWHAIQAGHHVDMLTIMAGAPPDDPPDTPIVRDNHTRWAVGDNPVAARRREDQQAAAIVGASTRYLDIPDCIYRTVDGQALYPSEDSLWATPHADDPAFAALATLDVSGYDRIYAPLAVGNHVDHQLTRDWATRLHARGYIIFLYEDYPYMRKTGAIQAVIDALPHQLAPFVTDLSTAALTAKIDAMRAYQSQISSFWDDAGAIADEVRQTFTDAERGIVRERAWRMT